MSKLSICVLSEKLVDFDMEVRDLEALLTEGGFRIVDKIEPRWSKKSQRWEAWFQVRKQELAWCRQCENYTPHKKYTFKYTSYRSECCVCGCPH